MGYFGVVGAPLHPQAKSKIKELLRRRKHSGANAASLCLLSCSRVYTTKCLQWCSAAKSFFPSNLHEFLCDPRCYLCCVSFFSAFSWQSPCQPLPTLFPVYLHCSFVCLQIRIVLQLWRIGGENCQSNRHTKRSKLVKSIHYSKIPFLYTLSGENCSFSICNHLKFYPRSLS